MDERDIRNGEIQITQSKTGAKRRITLEGELATVIDRIMTRKASFKVRCTRLIATDQGLPMTRSMLRSRFDTAREKAGVEKALFKMRDLRAKAGTDKSESSGDILKARDQLGHTTVTMTEHYVSNRKGKKSHRRGELRTERNIADRQEGWSNRWKPHDQWCPEPESNRHGVASEGF